MTDDKTSDYWPHQFSKKQMHDWYQEATIHHHIKEDGSHHIERAKFVAGKAWQAAKERYGRDEDTALDLLCIMFDGYEAGVDCYEDPEDQSGYVGRAFRLNDEDFHKIADLLNRRRPVSQPATKEQKHG